VSRERHYKAPDDVYKATFMLRASRPLIDEIKEQAQREGEQTSAFIRKVMRLYLDQMKDRRSKWNDDERGK